METLLALLVSLCVIGALCIGYWLGTRSAATSVSVSERMLDSASRESERATALYEQSAELRAVLAGLVEQVHSVEKACQENTSTIGKMDETLGNLHLVFHHRGAFSTVPDRPEPVSDRPSSMFGQSAAEPPPPMRSLAPQTGWASPETPSLPSRSATSEKFSEHT